MSRSRSACGARKAERETWLFWMGLTVGIIVGLFVAAVLT